MRLQTKILAGYLVLVAVICSMAAILVHERGRMREIDMEYNRTSPFISNCLHYSSEFHPYVGEFSLSLDKIGGGSG